MLYIFRTCREFLRTLPTLQYSKTYPEDVDSDLEDHIADETRYLCMMVPMLPEQAKAPKPIVLTDPLDRRIVRYPSRAEQREQTKSQTEEL